MFSPGVPPPAALGGVSYRTRRSFCRIRFDLTPRGLRLKNTHFESPEIILTSTVVCSVNPGFCLNRKEGGACCMMNGSSSSVSASQSSRVKSEQDDWSKEDCLTLLERIRSLLPDVDSMKYKTTESHFDWEKVCFGSFTGDMCRQKWQKVSTEVRKYRTMTELIVDAIEFVKNPYKGKKLKTHPDFPKKPLTPYFRFFMEKRAKYAKIHPEMSNLDLTKILSKKYKELPDKKKQKYITEFQREKEEFEKNMARFKEEHPELMEERKKSDLPEKPKTPQQLWYNHEKKTYMKLHPEVSQKELKEALRRQWSQLSDKRRLKWISKALELQKDYEDSMRAYHEAHPDVNSDDHVRSVLTKAERQLKDKFDGRPTKPPPNGYSLYCAELMVNMKDVPSTERMVLCSKQWKIMTQKEKDMFQKRCEQKKKQYDVDLKRFLESLPEEERDRVLTEEKLGGGRLSVGVASSPRRAKSPSLKGRCREVEPESWVPARPPKERRDGKKTAKLPETPKTAEEMWQHSVIGDYLAKYRSDRRKAQAAMEATWKSMEKKEKIPWIKRAAEDQKRYEVQYQHVRELLEMRAPAAGPTQRKPKFDGEPKKPPVSGYQMFSQELLTNGELNHFSLKERMVEIGKRWHTLSQSQKDKYKKQVEEQQVEYKAELEAWVQSLSPQEQAVYKEFSSSKRRSTTKARSSPGAKVHVMAKGKAVGSRAATPGVSVGKRAMAYRAKQDMSDTDDEEEKSSSDSDEDDETSGTTDSDDENDDDEDQTSSEESSDSDSD
ncbi:upstream binding transcription factor, like isoform X1 [Hippoglossus hippoglossus]|uniref:upstream binding transcription factor, like isoform X1 n=1 Tax=Hippoglossus hippoglossus TaxID=8267 RepID=UPI00148D4CA1|nr:upstream binding transcription factor, like isoform X1 [Hippoglossus hippoglossus]XP_034468718.1 upstream binding transcription factor, like isoform X1 [Hippoglossus hippoglossus]